MKSDQERVPEDENFRYNDVVILKMYQTNTSAEITNFCLSTESGVGNGDFLHDMSKLKSREYNLVAF